MVFCVGIEVFWEPYLSAIRFIYEWNDTSSQVVYHGYGDRPPKIGHSLFGDKFLLSMDERINKVTLYVGTGIETGGYTITVGSEIISYITGIQFHTTNERTTRLYGIKEENEFTESFEGYILGYVKGRSGLVIDELQFVWYKQRKLI